jgi:hypothetical protein
VRFSAQPVEGFERYRVAKDVDGAPTILISVAGEGSGVHANPIIIEHLVVQHDVDCRISRPDGSLEEGRFTLVRCRGQERILHVYFLRVASALIAALGSKPSQQDITRAVNKLVELFRVMSEPAHKSVQGLWAELLVIERAVNPATLVDAWHSFPEEIYDFSKDDQRIEVKSATGRIRRHHFSLEQLSPPRDATVLVASVLVERAGGGISIAELVDRVRSRLTNQPDLLLQVERIVALTLGENWRAALEDRFDREFATSMLAYFDATTVPSIRATIPPEVSGVSFTSDLSQTPGIDIKSYRAMGGLFKAALH